jgi:ATP-dependent Lon protease
MNEERDFSEKITELYFLKSITGDELSEIPVLPLKDIVVLPYMIFPVLAGRESTICAINKADETDKYILLLTQKNPNDEEPEYDNLNNIGTIAKIIQILRMPNGLIKVLVEGLLPANVEEFRKGLYISASAKILKKAYSEDNELNALTRQASKNFEEYVKSNPNIPDETLISYEQIKEPDKKMYFITSALLVPYFKKQKILEILELHKQFYEVIYLLTSEKEIINIEKDIENKIHKALQRNQRRFFVQEQIRILQDELGDDEVTDLDLIKIKEQIESSGMTDINLKKALDEFNKLKKLPQMSPDY